MVEKAKEIFGEYEHIVHGQPKYKAKDLLKPHMSEKDDATLNILSNRRPSMPFEEPLNGNGYTEPKFELHIEDVWEHQARKKHYTGPDFLKYNDADQIGLVLGLMENLDYDDYLEQEKEVSPTGLWRDREDMFDVYNDLRNFFGVLQHPYPFEDSVIQATTYSAEPTPVDDYKDIELGDKGSDIKNTNEYRSELPFYNDYEERNHDLDREMRFPKDQKIPTTLEEAKSINFDYYGDTDVDPRELKIEYEKKMAMPKQPHKLHPTTAKWDSDF